MIIMILNKYSFIHSPTHAKPPKNTQAPTQAPTQTHTHNATCLKFDFIQSGLGNWGGGGTFALFGPLHLSYLANLCLFLIACVADSILSLLAPPMDRTHHRITGNSLLQMLARCLSQWGVGTLRCNLRRKRLDHRCSSFLDHVEESRGFILVPFVSIFVHKSLRKRLRFLW